MIRKRIFLIDSFTLNTGDIAIIVSMINSIRGVFPEVYIDIEASHPLILKKIIKFKNITIFPRIFDIQFTYKKNSIRSLIQFLCFNIYDTLSFLVWALFSRFKINILFIIRPTRRRQAEDMKRSDAIISVGGGFLSSNYIYFFRLYILVLFILLDKKIMLFSQSIGPFDTVLSKKIIPFFLNKVSVITIREPKSYQFLKRFSIKTPVFLTSDAAFLLKVKKETLKRKIVSICIRKDKDIKKTNNYKEVLVKTIKYLLSEGYLITIVSQTIADDDLGIEMKNFFKRSVNFIKFQSNPDITRNIYSTSEFIIGTRMHSLIFASNFNVPFIAISYEPKFQGLLEQLKYDKDFMLSYANLNYENLLYSITKLRKNLYSIKSNLEKNVKLQALNSQKNFLIMEKFFLSNNYEKHFKR